MKRSLIYNERAEADELINKGFSNGFNVHDAVLVAKYYRHVIGYGDIRVLKALKEFCHQHDPFFVEVPKRRILKDIVSWSKRDFVNNTSGVQITSDEIAVLKTVQDYKRRRLLFVILVLSKFYGGKFYLSKWKHIRETLPSRITNKEISKQVTLLCKDGLMHIHGQYHEPVFINNASEPVILIDAKNIYRLNKVFEDIFGKDMFKCVDCEQEFEKHIHNQKRCGDCAKERKKDKWKRLAYNLHPANVNSR